MYLQGGLGNQLFQLAAGLATSQRLQVGLILDCSRLGEPGLALRKYALAPFNLPANVEAHPSKSNWDALVHKRSVNTLKNLVTRNHLVEKGPGFDPAFEAVKPGFTLDGYFQSVRYFESVKASVIEMIRSCQLTEHERERVDALSQKPFNAVHVRRGDYTDPRVAAVHGLAGPKYFQESLSILGSSSSIVRNLYFSDSPGIVQAELGLSPEDFAPNDLSEAATLLLMSRATNVIASNSTFSWWAGLVAEHTSGGAVIVPSPWFAGSTPPDLIPNQWLQITKN